MYLCDWDVWGGSRSLLHGSVLVTLDKEFLLKYDTIL